METLAIAICEDTDADRDRIEAAIASSGVGCACDFFGSGEAFLERFVSGKYDLVFLDVFMGGMTGVEVAKMVRAVDPEVMMAFATTSGDFAMEGYRARVERYLLKPFQDEDVHEVISSAVQRAGLKKERSLEIAGETIPHSRIRFVEQSNHVTIIHLMGGSERRRRGRLDDVEAELPCPPFYRCHKSYLVNLDHVKNIDRDLNVFELDGDERAYIRRASMAEARRLFEERMIERTLRLGER
ncbi:MAG: response regulator transcription factor [Eggerthellaceae bacterium]|nr:response regulator transcription factor [Eggerthellaceae bacterium]